jgi:hypothetical protein
LKLLGAANHLGELIDHCALLINGKPRVTDRVDEQKMRDLELDLLLNFGGHPVKLRENNAIDNSASEPMPRTKLALPKSDLHISFRPVSKLKGANT